MVDWTKKLQTRDGRSARLICTDRKGKDNPTHVVLIESDSGTDESVSLRYVTGHFYSNKEETSWDIINAPPVKKRGWINIYASLDSLNSVVSFSIYKTRQEANHASWEGRLDCVEIEWTEPA